MPCKYCGERDCFNLFLSSRLVNGKIETFEVCFSCYWLDRFRSEGENARLSEFEEGIFEEPEYHEWLRRTLQRGERQFI